MFNAASATMKGVELEAASGYFTEGLDCVQCNHRLPGYGATMNSLLTMVL